MKDTYISSLTGLTALPPDILSRLCDINVYVASHDVMEGVLKHEDVLSFETAGYGTVYIKVDGTDIRCRFKPSAEMENGIKQAVINKSSTLVKAIDEKFIKNVRGKYNDVFEGGKLAIEKKESMSRIQSTLVNYVANTKDLSRKDMIDKLNEVFGVYGCAPTTGGKK